MLGPLVAGVIGGALWQAGIAAGPNVARIARPLAVAATAQGIIAYRKIVAMTEEAYLAASDVLAEAQQQVKNSDDTNATSDGG